MTQIITEISPCFLPWILGIWLIGNGIACVVLSILLVFNPAPANRLFPFTLPLLFGELSIAFWLVIKGAKPRAAITATA